MYAWYAFILSKWNIEVSFSLSSSSPCSGSRYVIPLILFETWEKQLLLTIFSNQYLCTLGSSFGIMCAVTSILYTHHVMFLWSVKVASCTTVAVIFTSWSWMRVAWVAATFSTIMAVFMTAASRKESGLGYYIYYDYSGNRDPSAGGDIQRADKIGQGFHVQPNPKLGLILFKRPPG